MKKRLIVAIVASMLLVACSSQSVEQGEIIIEESEIVELLNIGEISYEHSKNLINEDTTLTQDQKDQLIAELIEPTEDTIVREMIDKGIVRQELLKLGIEVCYDDAKKANDENLELLNSSTDAMKSREEYIKAIGITEEEYIEEYEIPFTKSMLESQKLLEYYRDNIYNADTQELNESFLEYIDELGKNYAISQSGPTVNYD